MKTLSTIITEHDIIASNVTVSRETEKAVLFNGNVINGITGSRNRGSFWIAKSLLKEASMSVNNTIESYLIPNWLPKKLEVRYA